MSVKTFFVFVAISAQGALVVPFFCVDYVVSLEELLSRESQFTEITCKWPFFSNLHIIIQ